MELELETMLLISAGVGAIIGGNWGWLCLGIFLVIRLVG